MDIRILEQEQIENPGEGGITLDVTLDLDDLEQIEAEAKRALEIERSLPAEARHELADEDDAYYISDFVKTRATNDALEVYNIIPVAIPRVRTSGIASGSPYRCTVHVVPRPDVGLTSLDPVNLKTNRVAKPGFSAKAAQEGDESVEFLEDEKILRIEMVDRLDTQLSEVEMRALGEEYQNKFEKELAARNIDPESYQVAHGLDEEQYALMMTRRAISDAHWNYVLDAVFVGAGYTITEEELVAAFEKEFPGLGRDAFELHDLRNDLYLMIEKVRRARALKWLLDNAIK